MKLDNHIVNRLLLDKNFPVELVVTQAKHDSVDILDSTGKVMEDNLNRYQSMAHLLSPEGNKTYYITNSVVDNLELFDTKKCMKAEGWKIFKSLPDFKKTYILPDMKQSYSKYGGSGCVRVQKIGNVLYFCHISFKYFPPEKRTRLEDGSLYWVLLYIDFDEGEMCTHFQSEDGKSLAPFLYSLMCFIELTDNEVVVVQPKAKYGTRKAGKIINILPFPITVVTSRWNIITIRSEGFTVRGHIHLYWTGPGRTIPLMNYVAPYEKDGYTKRSGKQIDQVK